MAVVDKIDIEKCNITVIYFANLLSKVILKESYGSPGVHVWFDKYDDLSLKSKTREGRNSGIQIQYKIEDDTNIENLTSV